MKRTVRAIFNAILIIFFMILAFGFYSVAFAQTVTVSVGDVYEYSCVIDDPDESIFVGEFLTNGLDEPIGQTIEGRCVPGSLFYEQPSESYFGYRVPGQNNVNQFVFTEPGTFYLYEYSVSGNDVLEILTIVVDSIESESGFSSFLGSTTPLSIIGEVTGGVQDTSAQISPVVAFAGVPLAFTIGGYLLWFIRRSVA